jgi:PPOX class probable F420-dependent enzyme
MSARSDVAARSRIAMTPDEIAEYLHEPRTLNVVTVGPDGALHIVAMWFVMRGTSPMFWTYVKSQKVRNLERDPRMSGLVESGDVYSELRGVELIGTGHLVTDTDAVLELGRELSAKYGQRSYAGDLAKVAAKRVGIELRPDRTISWDHGKQAG